MLRHPERARRAAGRRRLEVLRHELLRAARDLVDVRRDRRRSATARAGRNVVNASTSSTHDIDNDTLPDRHRGSSIRTSPTSTPSVGGVCAGENWTVGHINQLMQSDVLEGHRHPLHDGRLRRLVRPRRRRRASTAATPTQPYGLGFRLPLIVISPYAKPGFVFKEVAEQASIPRFIETVFGATAAVDARSRRAGRAGQRSDGRVRLHADAAAAARAADAHLPVARARPRAEAGARRHAPSSARVRSRDGGGASRWRGRPRARRATPRLRPTSPARTRRSNSCETLVALAESRCADSPPGQVRPHRRVQADRDAAVGAPAAAALVARGRAVGDAVRRRLGDERRSPCSGPCSRPRS